MARLGWQDKLRLALLPRYRELPEQYKSLARRAFAVLQGPLFSRRARWLRDSYLEHITQERRHLFLCMSRFANVNRPIDGYYMEFGCFSAGTMRLAHDSFGHLFDWSYVAFDSFEGLPEIAAIDNQEAWAKGKLSMSEAEFSNVCFRHGIPRGRLRTVKGFYDRSLTPELQKELLPRKAAVVYVDCDLYTSTVPVLKFVRPFLQPGTIIVFDDWNCFLGDPEKGERRAWSEFRSDNPALRFEPFVQNGMQASFICLSHVERGDETET